MRPSFLVALPSPHSQSAWDQKVGRTDLGMGRFGDQFSPGSACLLSFSEHTHLSILVTSCGVSICHSGMNALTPSGARGWKEKLLRHLWRLDKHSDTTVCLPRLSLLQGTHLLPLGDVSLAVALAVFGLEMDSGVFQSGLDSGKAERENN